ncbi:AhpC/TSA family protein [Crossiella sp. SN42]|uniref:peroxiredoxin-like family protein n=1 Tax=Crossiella sp. SN42 TaxID=2944808 RepID=UPI00207C7D50|nr:peroxiredoxin-like family protein [Crossiella sp. SN42]MCO1580746.1 AhpC/TSA family protein [Crossiella sp. SN42]
MPSYAEQRDALVTHLATLTPAEVLAPFAHEQHARETQGLPPCLPTPGTPIPETPLLDAHGNPTTLAATRTGRAAVLVFYRGAWCPYCNLALRTYQEDLLPQLQTRDVALIAISPQRPDGSLSMREKNELAFPVLSDPGNELARALGIVTEATAESKAAQAKLGIDVAAANADQTEQVPMPAVLVLDRGGVIRWLEVQPNYANRTEPAAVLAAVAALESA